MTVANILTSLDYPWGEALFIATMFLPGALTVRFFLFKVSFRDMKKGLLNATYVVAGILVAEILLILIANTIVGHLKDVAFYSTEQQEIPEVTLNPFFIGIVITVLCVGDYMLSEFLKKRFRDEDATIRFNSNRSPVTLLIRNILYVESNDSETWVYANDGEKYRNKTPISHWEALLGDDFVRIHRSYLVNRTALTSTDADSVHIGDICLPVSRKYRDAIAD